MAVTVFVVGGACVGVAAAILDRLVIEFSILDGASLPI